MTLLSFWDFMDSLLPGLPFVFLAISIWCFYRAVKQHKSGSTWTDWTGTQHFSKDKVNFFSIGATVHGLIMLAAAIGTFIWMQSDK
jgi:uncharacterized membrane protein YbaN (DUF454 family)